MRGLWDIEQFELTIQTTRKTDISCLKNNQANGSIKKKERQGRASKKVPFKKWDSEKYPWAKLGGALSLKIKN